MDSEEGMTTTAEGEAPRSEGDENEGGRKKRKSRGAVEKHRIAKFLEEASQGWLGVNALVKSLGSVVGVAALSSRPARAQQAEASVYTELHDAHELKPLERKFPPQAVPTTQEREPFGMENFELATRVASLVSYEELFENGKDALEPILTAAALGASLKEDAFANLDTATPLLREVIDAGLYVPLDQTGKPSLVSGGPQVASFNSEAIIRKAREIGHPDRAIIAELWWRLDPEDHRVPPGLRLFANHLPPKESPGYIKVVESFDK